MKCRLCKYQTNKLFSSLIMDRDEIDYFICPNCDLLQTEEPYWLEEAYKRPINDNDTGLLSRNIQFAEKLKTIIYFLFNKEGSFLDYAGGYGVFTRLMRDKGFDFYWNDPFTENLFSAGFEYRPEIGQVELITSFESFEHFVNPVEEIGKIRDISGNIFFSTNVYPEPIPGPKKWWYYGLEHGQHVAFYSKRTMNYIADHFKLNFLSCSKYLHLLTEKKISKRYFEFLFKNSKYFSKYIDGKMGSKTFSDSKIVAEKGNDDKNSKTIDQTAS